MPFKHEIIGIFLEKKVSEKKLNFASDLTDWFLSTREK